MYVALYLSTSGNPTWIFSSTRIALNAKIRRVMKRDTTLYDAMVDEQPLCTKFDDAKLIRFAVTGFGGSFQLFIKQVPKSFRPGLKRLMKV